MPASEHYRLDDVARELASGQVSRGRAIKLLGAALAGGALALIPGVASAAPPAHANKGGRSALAPPSHAKDGQGFEPGAGGRFGSGGACLSDCTGSDGNADPSMCAPGCKCVFNPTSLAYVCSS